METEYSLWYAWKSYQSLQAISKEIRGKDNRNNIIEEMADVLICIEILKQVFEITDEDIGSWIKYKQERNLFRINCPQAD